MSILFIIVNVFPHLIILRLPRTCSQDLGLRADLELTEETSKLAFVSGMLAIGHNGEPRWMDVQNVQHDGAQEGIWLSDLQLILLLVNLQTSKKVADVALM